jgi:hypothetical protein
MHGFEDRSKEPSGIKKPTKSTNIAFRKGKAVSNDARFRELLSVRKISFVLFRRFIFKFDVSFRLLNTKDYCLISTKLLPKV